MRKKVAFYTLGCKVNSAETDVMAATFVQKGYDVATIDDECDVVLFNTCTVTHSADSQARQAIRKARRTSPGAVIAVVGCYAQADPQAVSEIPGVDIILGTRERFAIFDLLENNSCQNEIIIQTDLNTDPFEHELALPYDTQRTRAFLKVQDGCDYPCTYCIIPSVRGNSISRKHEQVIERAIAMRDSGFKEIVLTAVNLGEYENGRDYGLINLLEELDSIHDVPRMRLTSIEPNKLTEQIIRFVAASENVCSHFHVPLQSGSDYVLARMKRRYKTSLYEKVVNNIVEHIPDAAIGADVMVGFPGETEKHFEETYKFLENSPVTYLHVFRYSPRSGTEAAEFSDFVPHAIVKERSEALLALSDRKKEQFLEAQLGRTAKVLFESKLSGGAYSGFTSNYARVRCDDMSAANRFQRVKLLKKDGMILEGQLVA